MWFKNCRIYRFSKPFELNSEDFNQALQSQTFTPCHSQQQASFGFVSSLGQNPDELVHTSLHYHLVCAKRQEKILPAAVVNEQLQEKVAELEAKESRKLSNKEKTAIKEELQFELLPKAFTKSSKVFAYIDSKNQLLFINTSSASRAEDLINAIREAVGSFAVIPLAAKNTPIQIMTDWLKNAQMPEGFELGLECELKEFQEDATVKCKNLSLVADEVLAHIEAGFVVKQLALNWQDKISFIVDDTLAIKRIKYSELIDDASENLDDLAAQLDADFAIMTGELSDLIQDVLKAFGGYATLNEPTESEGAETTPQA